MSNPYIQVHRKLRRRQPFAWGQPLLCLAAMVAAPLAQPSLLYFLPSQRLGLGLEGIAFRLAALIAAALALKTYAEVVRGADREVLAPHPIDARALIHALALRVYRQTWPWALSCWILIWPLAAAGHRLAYLLVGLLICSAWIGMIGLGYLVHLASVWAARSPKIEGLLHAIRGANPKEQAAFIYGPSLALFIIGITLMIAAKAIVVVIAGNLLAIFWLLLPMLMGCIAFLVAQRLATKQYVLASAVLAEIDAKWAVIEQAEESHRVYLDWLAQNNRELLRALRQGWRSLRLWPLGGWAIGALAFVSAWSGDIRTSTWIIASGVVIVSAVPALLAAGDPKWLDDALGVKAFQVAKARCSVAVLYAQGPILLPAVLLYDNWSLLLQLEALSVLCASISAVLSVRLRERSLMVYAPLGLLLWASTIGFLLMDGGV